MILQDGGFVMPEHPVSSTHPYLRPPRKKTGYLGFVSCAPTALASAHFSIEAREWHCGGGH